jgi:hypothetical protein
MQAGRIAATYAAVYRPLQKPCHYAPRNNASVHEPAVFLAQVRDRFVQAIQTLPLETQKLIRAAYAGHFALKCGFDAFVALALPAGRARTLHIPELLPEPTPQECDEAAQLLLTVQDVAPFLAAPVPDNTFDSLRLDYVDNLKGLANLEHRKTCYSLIIGNTCRIRHFSPEDFKGWVALHDIHIMIQPVSIAQILTAIPQLQGLSLSRCTTSVTPKDLTAIRKARNLKELRFDYCGISEKDKKALQDLWKKCKRNMVPSCPCEEGNVGLFFNEA